MAFWQNIPFFSILIALASASFTSIMPAKAARRTAIAVTSVVLGLSGLLIGFMYVNGGSYTFMMGHFPAPWGNEIRASLLEAVTAFVFALIMLISLLGGLSKVEEHVEESKQNLYFIMCELLLTALLAQVYTNDLFTAYVFVEIMTIAACSLITARTKGRTLVAATRYMVMNLLGSGLFLLGLTLLYDLTGHLLMENIHEQVVLLAQTGRYHQPLTVVIALMCLGLAIKSALFPFHTWLPDAYGYTTPASSAMLSSLVSKGYIFLLIKVMYRVIGLDVIRESGIDNILLVFALVGVVMGSVSAIKEKDIRRMISYSSVAQIGYIFMGIGLGSEAGMVAAIFHIFAHAAAKSMLFLSAGGLCEVSGERRMFRDLRGSAYRNPVAGVAFVVGAFSMVGIPFFGGFMSKLCFASAAMQAGGMRMILVLLVLAISTALNTLYFLRTVITIYRPAIREYPEAKGFRPRASFAFAMVVSIGVNIALGVCSQPVLNAITLGLAHFG